MRQNFVSTVVLTVVNTDAEFLFCLLSAVENLQNLLFTRIRDRKLKDEMEIHGGQLRTADISGVADDNPAANAKKCEIHMLGTGFL